MKKKKYIHIGEITDFYGYDKTISERIEEHKEKLRLLIIPLIFIVFMLIIQLGIESGEIVF